MVRHQVDRDTPPKVMLHWFLMSFLAGDINSGGLLACGRFVSHTTGFYTLFGQSAAHLAFGEAFGLLSIPMYFLLGAMICAVFVDRPLQLDRQPQYTRVMSMTCACLFASAALGSGGWFGSFGRMQLESDYLLLSLLCFGSGLLNTAVSCSSGRAVRITHMTGNTTDLGVDLVRVFTLKPTAPRYGAAVKAAQLRGGLIGAFIIGAALGSMMFVHFSYLGFLLPAFIALYFTVHEAVLSRRDKHLL